MTAIQQSAAGHVNVQLFGGPLTEADATLIAIIMRDTRVAERACTIDRALTADEVAMLTRVLIAEGVADCMGTVTDER